MHSKMILPLIGILLLFLTYYKLIKPYFYWRDKGVPYVKYPWPFIGNLNEIILRINNIPKAVDKFYKSGHGKRFIGVYNFFEPVLIIRDVDLIKQITVKDFDTFPDHKPFSASDEDELGLKHIGSLQRSEGWQDMRSTLSPSFTSSKMKMIFVLMQTCSDQLVDHLKTKGDVVKLNLKDLFSRAAIDIIATTVFGMQLNSLEDKNNEFFIRAKEMSTFTGLKSLILFISTTFIGKILNLRFFNADTTNFFSKIVLEAIKYRKENSIVRKDMLHLLMEAQRGQLEHDPHEDVIDSGFAVVEESELGKAKKRIKAKFDDDDIVAQLMIFFFAGFEGVTNSLCFVMYELACNPDVQAKLYEEICDTLTESAGGEELKYEQLLSMNYLDCVISETVRLHVTAGFTDRKSVKPYTIEPKLPGEKPVHLPAGSLLWIPSYSIHRDPQYYQNPEKFDPERFNDENKHNIKPFTYLSFGMGPRNCIGSRFALLELKIFTFKLLQHFEIVSIDKTKIPHEYPKASLNLISDKDGMWLGLKKRKV